MANDDYNDSLALNVTEERTCLNIRQAFPDKIDTLEVQIALSICYWTIFVAGLIGNVSALLLILRQEITRLLHGIYIASLTVSTLLLALTSLPVTAVQIFTRSWPYGEFLCRLTSFLQSTNVFAISLVLCAIAIDRYLLVVRPFRQSSSPFRLRCTWVIVGLWVMSAGMSCPYVFYVSLVENYTTFDNETLCEPICAEIWPTEVLRKTFGLLVILVQFGGPILVFVFCYGAISRTVKCQIRTRLSRASVLADTQVLLQKRRSNVNSMIFRLICSFVLPWFLLHFLNVAADLGFLASLIPDEWQLCAVAVAHCVAMTTCVWNPIVYAYYHPDIRRFITESLSSRRSGTSRESAGTKEPRCNGSLNQLLSNSHTYVVRDLADTIAATQV